jgi:hypothetical protein
MAVCAVAVDTRWRAQGSCHETAVLVLPGGGGGAGHWEGGFPQSCEGEGEGRPLGTASSTNFLERRLPSSDNAADLSRELRSAAALMAYSTVKHVRMDALRVLNSNVC